MNKHECDFLVIGSGIGGLSYALKVADYGRVILVSKAGLNDTNTSFAQGGIAAVTYPPDDIERHIADTLVCGDGLCNEEVVRLVCTKGPEQINQLIHWGTIFDRQANGQYDLAREGGHTMHRILHHKDNTGAEIQRALSVKVRQHRNIQIYENYFAVEIITQHHLGEIVKKGYPNITCYGAYVLDVKTQKVHTFLAKNVVMATGGTGNIYNTTSNPTVATGDGIAMVYRAKGQVENMAFVQFHPTTLYNPGERPSYLITEAMRGFGAVLKTTDGKDLMERYDSRGSLAPRDIVARAIDHEMKIRGDEFVYLDATRCNPVELVGHFPNIYQKCLSLGIDITKDMIPVVPAAHYQCGGIKVDMNARTSIHNLYAVGECASTGLHGANRLASNSLTEAIVYADQAAKHSIEHLKQTQINQAVPEWDYEGTTHNEEMVLITQSFKEMQQIMSNYVGIVRSNLRLQRALDRLEILFRETEELYKVSILTQKLCELRNLLKVGYLVIKDAKNRHESRGLHYTIDYPKHQGKEF